MTMRGRILPIIVQQFLPGNNWTVAPHSLYLPSLAPCNFFLFPKVKIKLKGQRFDATEVLNTKIYFQVAFNSWQIHLDQCLNSQGHCFKDYGGE